MMNLFSYIIGDIFNVGVAWDACVLEKIAA